MSVYALIQLCAALAAAAVICIAVVKRQLPKTLYYTFLALACGFYAIGYLMEITAASQGAAEAGLRVQNLGIPFIGPLYYLFVRDYYNRPVHRRLFVALLVLPSVCLALLAWAWPASTLYYAGLTYTAAPYPHLILQPAPLYYAGVVYTYGLVVAGIVLVARSFPGADASTRRRNLLFLAGTALPAAALALYHTGATPSGFDATPTALTLTLLVAGGYMLRQRREDWMPYARESVLENISDAFILLDDANRYLDSNAVAQYYFPRLQTLARGVSINKVAEFPIALLDKNYQAHEFTLESEGGPRYLRASQSPIFHGSKPVCNCIMIYDVTEMRLLMDELNELATLDALTGLYNRGHFFSMAARDFSLALRNHEAASVLMLDIDFFKLVNDQYGHLCGDMVLRELANILRGRLRRTDIIGRYGGEEICIFLPGAGREGANLIAEILRRAVEQKTFVWNEADFRITISLGVATLATDKHDTLEALISDADAALYRAKATGRNRVCLN